MSLEMKKGYNNLIFENFEKKGRLIFNNQKILRCICLTY